MGSIKNKLTYLNETKQQLKDVINYADGGIISDTPFRQYPDKLYNQYIEILKDKNVLFDGMPKKEINNTSIYIDNATDLPVYELKVNKESTQDTTSGKNKITFNNLSDISLLNIQTHYDNSTIKFNGTTNGSGQLIPISPLNIMLPSGTYTISYRIKSGTYNVGTAGNDIAFYLRNESSSLLNQTLHFISTDGTPQSKTFTLAEDTFIYFQAYCNASGIILNNLLLEIQIEEGSTATSYEPYTGGITSPNPDYPQEVKTVKGYRNLFDKDNVTWRRNNNGGFNTGNINNNTIRIRTSSFEIVGGNTYIINGIPNGISLMMIRTFNEYEGGKIADIRPSENVFVLDNSVKYIHLLFGGSNFTDETNELMKNADIQIVKGTEELPYVPYGTNYVAITNTNGTDTNYYTIPLNGNEIAGKGINLDELIINKHGHCFINKKFAKIDSYNGETITTDYWSTTGGLDIGATIYYVLSEPQLIDLNYTVDIELFKGINNISNSEDGNMVLQYVPNEIE